MGFAERLTRLTPCCVAILLVALIVAYREGEAAKERIAELVRGNAALRHAAALSAAEATPLPIVLFRSEKAPASAPQPADPGGGAPAAPPTVFGDDVRAGVADAEERWGNLSTLPIRSAAHCIGREPGRTRSDHTSWKRVTCHFRNLCFDPAARDFVYLKGGGDDFDPGRDSVALGALNAQWSPSDAELVRWAPRVVDMAAGAPVTHRMAPVEEVWVPHMEHCAANVMHLVLDQFLPWYAAVSLFGLLKRKMRPLRVPSPKHPLWGTCDFIRAEEARGERWAQGYPRRCDANIAKWLPAMLPGQRELAETGRVSGARDRRRPAFAESAQELRCFPHAVAGIGPLSDHCLRSHGWAWDPEGRSIHDCNQGRGWLLWGFRGHMLAAALGARPPPPPPARHKVALFTAGHRAGGMWHAWTREVRAAYEPRGVTVWPADLSRLSAAAQIEAVASVTVCVAAMGGNALTALFLPRGAGLLLATDGDDRLDWDVWAHASWMRVSWLKVRTPGEQVAATVGRELRKYEAFRPRGPAFQGML